MPNVAEIIKDHVTLEVRCVDRLYLNAYVPRLQTSGGVIDFLVRVSAEDRLTRGLRSTHGCLQGSAAAVGRRVADYVD